VGDSDALEMGLMRGQVPWTASEAENQSDAGHFCGVMKRQRYVHPMAIVREALNLVRAKSETRMEQSTTVPPSPHVPKIEECPSVKEWMPCENR
jgi:hypothetical protein